MSSLNLLKYSTAFDNAAWTTNNMPAPTTGQTDPSGGTGGCILIADTTNGSHNKFQPQVVSGDLCFTVHAKPAAGTMRMMLNLYNATNDWEVFLFDLVGGTPVAASGTSSTFTNVSATQTASGNGYYKCTIKATGSITNALLALNPNATTSGLDSYGGISFAGDGTAGITVAFASLSTVGSSDYNATTSQIHREYSSTLKSVATSGQPRFEYDPAADGQSVGTALGLLVESQSTNYNTKSEDIAGWSTPSNMTVSASAMVAPNGTLTADVLTVSDDTVASGHFAYRASSDGTSGQTVAASFFAKTAGVNHIYFYDANTANAGADSVSIFDLNNGTIGGTNAPNCKMIDCGNGWWRCVSVYTLTGAGTSLRFYTTDNGSTTTYIGNGFDGFGLWGVQVEIGVSSESSYISTSGSTVSRAADSCSVDLSATNYSGGEGSLVVDLSVNGRTSGIGAVISDGSTENYYQVGQFASSLTYILYSELNNSVQANITQAETSIGSKKLAASWDTNDISACLDGGAVTTDTSNAFPLLTDLDIGSNPTGAAVLNGHIKRLSLFNVALSDVELQSLTSS